MAVVAVFTPRVLSRGGRHTDQGEFQSSKKAERKSSSVSLPRFGLS